MLKEAREKKGLTPSQVESTIKIREKFIIAIENDEFSILPSPSYAKGFVRNYAEFLGLPIDPTMAIFRRQTFGVVEIELIAQRCDGSIKYSFFQLTPARFLTLIVTLLFVVFFFVSWASVYTRKRQADVDHRNTRTSVNRYTKTDYGRGKNRS